MVLFSHILSYHHTLGPYIPPPPPPNSYIKPFFTRLYSQYKKPYKIASTAAMRKLLILANSLVRDDRVFTEEYNSLSVSI
ncbi:hypothetical protein [Wolbachia endosymbiont (group A) of Campoletis raptor]|uniref:hypothetical protein n=1 Tax=Wolbachia endosymbiont (group A) of Campoletis raptor TaxID=3066196 RepID=UPI003132E6AA